MRLQRSCNVNWFITFGILSLFMHAIIGVSRIAYSDEVSQKPAEELGGGLYANLGWVPVTQAKNCGLDVLVMEKMLDEKIV